MALYIPHSIFRLARLLYVRPETFGPYYVLIDIAVYHKRVYSSLTSLWVTHISKCCVLSQNEMTIFYKYMNSPAEK